MASRSLRLRSRKGNNLIEFALLAPWYVFLFMGAIDMGIYNYSLIGVQNAARSVALYCSTSSTTCSSGTAPCLYALDQLRDLPNVGSTVTTCSSPSPVTISVTYPNGPDGNTAAQVTVGYTAPPLFSLPKGLPGQYTASRTVTMRTRS
jgi:Flp pilus assembly protein TadG